LRKILSFCVATLCLYFAFKQVNLEDINRAISNSNFYYILIALLTTYITFILRSIRWKILLDSPSNLKLNKYISTTHIGYFLNNILPFRAGDLGRAKLLSNHSNKIRFSFLLGSLVAEKIIDLWMIGFFSIYLIFFGFNDVLGLKFSIGILLLYIITSLIIFGNNSVVNNIQNKFSITKNFVDGYLLVSKNKLKLGIVSLLLWSSFVVYMVALLKSINIHLSFEQYIGITIITGIVTSLPIAPAAIGTYHLAVIYFLSLYGIGIEQSQTAAILLHSIFLLYTIILGYIYLSFEKVELKSLIDDNKN
jgi:uncharacterized protein (TIRG00374 family)|tara:strand:- start:1455 stop:2372 length:918 start_codon:yes stop_codon:yes gene_type:complete